MRERRHLIQFPRAPGDVHRLVGDPLQVVAQLHGGDVPQIARHRLEAQQEVDPVLVHCLLELVDLLVVRDDRCKGPRPG